MARYDYGLRGRPDPIRPRMREPMSSRYANDLERRWRRRRPPPNYVSAPYNIDYVTPLGDPRPFNPYRFGGGWARQMEDERGLRRPYMTRAGTRTSRGVPFPPRYDYRDFGPDYGGRYPDEL